MIPFKSFLVFKKVDKEAWLASKLLELETEFDADLKAVKNICTEMIEEKEEELRELKKKYEKDIMMNEKLNKKVEMSNFDLEENLKRVNDKKVELAKANKDLAQQIRLLEAKASPDQVWLSAFQMGFSKAWGMMKPVIYDGFDKVKQEISDNAKMETLNGLQSVLGRNHGFNPEKD